MSTQPLEPVEQILPTDRVPLGTCDKHPSANAITLWERDALELTLCGNCSNRLAPQLDAQGFKRTYVNLEPFKDDQAR